MSTFTAQLEHQMQMTVFLQCAITSSIWLNSYYCTPPTCKPHICIYLLWTTVYQIVNPYFLQPSTSLHSVVSLVLYCSPNLCCCSTLQLLPFQIAFFLKAFSYHAWEQKWRRPSVKLFNSELRCVYMQHSYALNGGASTGHWEPKNASLIVEPLHCFLTMIILNNLLNLQNILPVISWMLYCVILTIESEKSCMHWNG